MSNKRRHCEKRSDEAIHGLPRSLCSLAMTALLLLLTPIANAQEKDLSDILAETTLAEGYVRHAPKDCGFEVTFPSEPYISKRCSRSSKTKVKNCTKLTSYTMVYDLATSIEINVTCVPSTPAQYKKYNKDVISIALNGMVSRSNITEHEINISEDDDVRQGSLLGSTKRGKQNSLYNAQLWIGQNSIMTIEAKLIGPFHAEADTVFSEILASLKKQEATHDEK